MIAAILGFHSMMNQDQYHASLLNKGQPVGLGWDGITKATKPKVKQTVFSERLSRKQF